MMQQCLHFYKRGLTTVYFESLEMRMYFYFYYDLLLDGIQLILHQWPVTSNRAKFQGYATFWATIDNPTHSD